VPDFRMFSVLSAIVNLQFDFGVREVFAFDQLGENFMVKMPIMFPFCTENCHFISSRKRIYMVKSQCTGRT
jgi:hypothetical protein